MKTLLLTILLAISFNSIAKDLNPTEIKYKTVYPEHFENYLSAYELVNNWHNSRTKIEDVNKAELMLNKIILANKNYAPAYRELGRVYAIKGDHISSVQSINKSIEIEPNYADSYVLLGFQYFLFYKMDSAESALDQAEKLGAKSPWLELTRGFIYKREGDNEKSFEKCKAVYSTTTNFKAKTHATSCLVDYYKEKQNHKLVNKYYKELIKNNPYYFEKQVEYSSFLMLQKRFEEAIIESKKLLNKTKSKQNQDFARYLEVTSYYGIWADYVYNNGENENSNELLMKANIKLAELNVISPDERVSFSYFSQVFNQTKELQYLSEIFIAEESKELIH